MKELYRKFSKLMTLLCQMAILLGFFWYLKSNSSASSMRFGDSQIDSAQKSMEFISSAKASESGAKAKIIKTGRLSLSTDKLSEGRKIISQILPEFKAYIMNEEEGKSSSSLHISMTIRVPAEQFDALVTKVIGSGFIVDSKSIQASDVTEQYIDVEARLANKKILIEKYTTLLSKSQKIADTLEINRQLETTSADLEVLEGRMKYLNNQISLSTLDLYLEQKLTPTEQHGQSFFSDLKYQAKEGLSSFRGALLFILGLWPFIIIISVVGFFAYRRFKKRS